MEKNSTQSKDTHPVPAPKKAIDTTGKEIDPDSEMHKTSPDLIQKEDHHLPVDDEVKKG